MDINVLRKHNDLPGAKKVFFVPMNTLMVDYYDAFMRNGFELYSINFEDKWSDKEYTKEFQSKLEQIFLDVCRNQKPEWIFFLCDCSLISTDTIKLAKQILPNSLFTNWTGDVRQGLKPGVEEIGKVVDITYIVGTGQIDLYKSRGLKRVEFSQTGLDVSNHYPLSDERRAELKKLYKHDIVFCANNAGGYPGQALRMEVADKLCKTFGSNFGLYGGGWDGQYKNSVRGSISYNTQNDVYAASVVVISINNFNNVAMYFSCRQLNAMATGTLTLSCYIPGLENYFENKKDLVWFHSADECVDLVKYYLAHQDEARCIGLSGCDKIFKSHTKFDRIKELKERLGF
jgi:hypothetical protein